VHVHLVLAGGRLRGRRPSIRTQTANLDRTITQEIVFAQLGNAFALLALLITCVGLYGTVRYGMVRRTEEIGIRMALGASRAGVLRLAFGQVLSLGVAGLVIGVPAALVASRFVESFLWASSQVVLRRLPRRRERCCWPYASGIRPCEPGVENRSAGRVARRVGLVMDYSRRSR
jgi:predicted lysophospholipase L1 biosynthesis ABC-type transport system permease subunit